MIEYIEYTTNFTYLIDDDIKFVDEFVPNETFSIIRIKGNRTIEKRFMNKNAQYKPNKEYNIAIYHKNKWIYLYNGFGTTTTHGSLCIPNLKIIDIKNIPYLTKYSFNFELHILITLLHKEEEIEVLEYKRPCLQETEIKCNNIKIKVYDGILVYRGEDSKEFINICKDIEKIYKKNNKEIKYLFDLLDKPNTKTHKAIAYKTWYNAKRQNQREWPLISTIKRENSIEFPEGSGIYYYHETKQVGLAKRYDINDEKYIPKLYNKLRGISEITIPNVIRNKYKISNKHTRLENEKYLEIGFDGEEIELHQNAKVLVYRNYIIKEINMKNKYEYKAQILDINNKRIKVLNKNNEWINDSGGKIIGIPALPYNYKQIIHDCKKLNKLIKGEIEDLTDIGIVGNDTRTIKFPIDELYISNTLETRRLMTFKYNKNIKIEIIK